MMKTRPSTILPKAMKIFRLVPSLVVFLFFQIAVVPGFGGPDPMTLSIDWEDRDELLRLREFMKTERKSYEMEIRNSAANAPVQQAELLVTSALLQYDATIALLDTVIASHSGIAGEDAGNASMSQFIESLGPTADFLEANGLAPELVRQLRSIRVESGPAMLSESISRQQEIKAKILREVGEVFQKFKLDEISSEHPFVKSSETGSAGPHGISGRSFSVEPPPSVAGLEDGWNYSQNAEGEKHGLQIYQSDDHLAVELFQNGKRLATGSYRSGKPDGWFNLYFGGEKVGTHYYFSGDLATVETYSHDLILTRGSYRDGKPDGWFNVYQSGDKHGRQVYVSGEIWHFEEWKGGKQDGRSEAYTGTTKNGVHATYSDGKKVSGTYFIDGQEVK